MLHRCGTRPPGQARFSLPRISTGREGRVGSSERVRFYLPRYVFVFVWVGGRHGSVYCFNVFTTFPCPKISSAPPLNLKIIRKLAGWCCCCVLALCVKSRLTYLGSTAVVVPVPIVQQVGCIRDTVCSTQRTASSSLYRLPYFIWSRKFHQGSSKPCPPHPPPPSSQVFFGVYHSVIIILSSSSGSLFVVCRHVYM